MKITNTKFKGLKIIKGVNHYDKRGYFREVFINKIFKNKKFIFWCLSKSKKRVVRGLHLQKKLQQVPFDESIYCDAKIFINRFFCYNN